jgi:2'-5' RNA ligase
VRSRLPAAAWTQPGSWHLTVRFLGEITEEAAHRFSEAIAPAAAIVETTIPAAGPVVFPPRGRPRVLGMGFGAGQTLGELARAAEEAARAIGCDPEERPFRPHVTLARLRDPWPVAAVEQYCESARAWAFPAWRVRSVVLYRSRLEAAGAIHTPVREWTAAGDVAGARA